MKSLLAIVGVLCLVFSRLSNLVRTQDHVIQEVDRLGGHVWNVHINEGGAIYPHYPEWLPAWSQGLVPKRLNYIYLTGDSILDDHLNVVVQMPGLEGLNVSSSKITDVGLRRLRACTGLRELQLYDVESVSPEAIAAFEAAVPRCKIHR